MATLTPLNEAELSLVCGGMDLSDEAPSKNFEVQRREGPYIVTYDSAGRCIKVVYAPL
jgi:hypothetical protein